MCCPAFGRSLEDDEELLLTSKVEVPKRTHNVVQQRYFSKEARACQRTRPGVGPVGKGRDCAGLIFLLLFVSRQKVMGLSGQEETKEHQQHNTKVKTH